MFQDTLWNSDSVVELGNTRKQAEIIYLGIYSKKKNDSQCHHSNCQRCLTSHTGTLCAAFKTTHIQQLLLKTSFHQEQLTIHINIDRKVQSLGKKKKSKKSPRQYPQRQVCVQAAYHVRLGQMSAPRMVSRVLNASNQLFVIPVVINKE